jgi:hypothetical protein
MNKNKNVLRKRWQAPFKKKLFVALTLVLLPGLLFGSTINIKQVGKTSSSRQQSSSQKLKQRSQVQELTTSLVTLNQQYQAAEKPVQEVMLDNLLEVAIARQAKLAALIEEDPQAVLQVALPKNLRAALPRSIRNSVEQQVAVDGELEVIYEDYETESRLLHFLKVGDDRLSLHFAGEAPTGYMTGSKVRVEGVRVGNAVALESGNESLKAASGGVQPMTMTICPNTFGEQKVLVLLVNFQDKQTQPWTIDQVRNVVFTSVNNFYKESSYQQTWLTGDVFGWYTLPISSASCDQTTIATYAKQAATAAGVNLSAYNRHVFAFPSLSCGWTGWGTYGGNPSQAWINGSMSLRTVGHELGHNFGLYHARSLDCGSQVVGSTCTYTEYGDIVDILGQSGVTGHSHAHQKERLGWLGYGSSPGITTVQSSGTYWIDPYETVGSSSKALKVLKSVDSATGKKTWYYVEFRRPVGFDSFVSGNNNVMNGVVVHTGTEAYSFDLYLLDMTPETTSWNDPALVVGRSYNDPNINVTITPLSVSNTGASVNVSFGPQPCVRVNPSMSLSPSASQWVAAGSTMTYQLSVTNNDSTGCTASSFNLQSNVPSGWSSVFGNPSLSINPGESATTTLTVTSPTGTAEGFYNLGVTAANSSNTSYSATSSVTCVIVASLAVGVSSDRSSYSRTQTATVTASVNALGSPVSGATVSFTMTKANGAVVSKTVTTGTDGKAVFSYRFNKKNDPTGTYQAAASANLNGISGSGATSFVVQ